MLPLILLIAVVSSMLLAGAFLLGRILQRRRDLGDDLSPVTRQHIELFQGGQLNEAAVESAKRRFRALLERGQIQTVEESLRPGTQFVIHVRALAEIGTEDAGRILERQLERRLTDNQVEQAWYWIDLADCLRSLNREQSLPHLLRCADQASQVPLGQFLAAETACFLSFAGYLRQPTTLLGQAALRVLRRALEGIRSGVQPQVIVEGRLGEAIESLWDHRPDQVDPLVVRVFVETGRQIRRAPHAERILAEEKPEREAFEWQMSRLSALQESLEDYLEEAAAPLLAALRTAQGGRQRDILHALDDLRADTAAVLLPLLETPGLAHVESALATLTWSRDPSVGPRLRAWAARRVPMDRRAMQRGRALPPRQPSVPVDVPYRAILRALRGHPSPETESFLLLASRDWDPTFRATAVSSLAWWEPFHRHELLRALQSARRDFNPEVRQCARAALARLGERHALQWFRQALNGEDSHRVHQAIQVIAEDGIFLLWPDLDHLAEISEPDVAYHAREALEQLNEDLHHRSW